MTFSLTLRPAPGQRDAVIQYCNVLVEEALASGECPVAVYGQPAGDDEAVVCEFLFGADGPLSRFTSIRRTSTAYMTFRQRVEPLLTEPLKVKISHAMAGYVATGA